MVRSTTPEIDEQIQKAPPDYASANGNPKQLKSRKFKLSKADKSANQSSGKRATSIEESDPNNFTDFNDEVDEKPEIIDPDSVRVKGHWHPTFLKIWGKRVCHVSTASAVVLVVELVAQIVQIGYGAWAWNQPKHLYEVDEPATQGTLAIIKPAEMLCAILFDFVGPAGIMLSIFTAFAGMALRSCKLLIPHAIMQLVSVIGLLLQCFVTVVTPMEYHAELINRARIFDGYIPGHVVPYHKGKLFGICFFILCLYTIGILLQVWFIEILKHYFFYLVDQTNYWPDGANGPVVVDAGAKSGADKVHPVDLNGVEVANSFAMQGDVVEEAAGTSGSSGLGSGSSSKKSSTRSTKSKRSVQSDRDDNARKNSEKSQKEEKNKSPVNKSAVDANNEAKVDLPAEEKPYRANMVMINGPISDEDSDNDDDKMNVNQNIVHNDVEQGDESNESRLRSRNIGPANSESRVIEEKF